jgi:hypothetical protein
MNTIGNDPASPVLMQPDSLQNETSLGLTKREQFAMAAMQGILAKRDIDDLMKGQVVDVAGLSVDMADLLIDALNKSSEYWKAVIM